MADKKEPEQEIGKSKPFRQERLGGMSIPRYFNPRLKSLLDNKIRAS
jgi:hypothetical protein